MLLVVERVLQERRVQVARMPLQPRREAIAPLLCLSLGHNDLVLLALRTGVRPALTAITTQTFEEAAHDQPKPKLRRRGLRLKVAVLPCSASVGRR